MAGFIHLSYFIILNISLPFKQNLCKFVGPFQLDKDGQEVDNGGLSRCKRVSSLCFLGILANFKLLQVILCFAFRWSFIDILNFVVERGTNCIHEYGRCLFWLQRREKTFLLHGNYPSLVRFFI